MYLQLFCMLDVNHADDGSVWYYIAMNIIVSYNQRIHCYWHLVLFINLYINTLVLYKTILHKGSNLSFRKIGVVWAKKAEKVIHSYFFLH